MPRRNTLNLSCLAKRCSPATRRLSRPLPIAAEVVPKANTSGDRKRDGKDAELLGELKVSVSQGASAWGGDADLFESSIQSVLIFDGKGVFVASVSSTGGRLFAALAAGSVRRDGTGDLFCAFASGLFCVFASGLFVCLRAVFFVRLRAAFLCVW